MESQSQNPEFRNNPENFHPCQNQYTAIISNISTQQLNVTDR